jgi:uncharacterized protein
MTASAPSQDQVLALFAKKPVTGLVKTRLTALASSEWATEVANAFLLDSVSRFSQVPARRFLAFAPADAADYFSSIASGKFDLLPQAEGDLGARLSSFFADRFAAHAEAVVVVGADSPTLPVAFIEQAFRALRSANVVLGPATDGGYYLVGLTHGMPELFSGVPWGTSRVLKATINRIPADCSLALLPPWYDVDTWDDWQMLRGHVAALRRMGVDVELPHTEALLNRPAL